MRAVEKEIESPELRLYIFTGQNVCAGREVLGSG